MWPGKGRGASDREGKGGACGMTVGEEEEKKKNRGAPNVVGSGRYRSTFRDAWHLWR